MVAKEEKLIKKTAEKLFSLLEESDFEIEVKRGKEKEWQLKLEVSNPDRLIGYQGKTLDALQLILKLMICSQLGEWRPVLLDINGYREKQKERVISLAQKAASEVEVSQRPVYLPPMSSWERRLVHLSLADHPVVTTASEGEGGERRVVVKPKA